MATDLDPVRATRKKKTYTVLAVLKSYPIKSFTQKRVPNCGDLYFFKNYKSSHKIYGRKFSLKGSRDLHFFNKDN